MELFSEIYGCYFTVVSRLLNEAQKGLSKPQIEQLVASHGFYDSTFHLLPNLFSDEWSLLYEQDKTYYSKLSGEVKRPLTTLEKSWLKAIINDNRIRLFLDDEQLLVLQESLADIEPLFLCEDFHTYDQHRDGDDYCDSDYIFRFKSILSATKHHTPLIIAYDSKNGRTKRQYHPYKLCYSTRDDKFRLLCAVYNSRKKCMQRVTLNLARITSVQSSEHEFQIGIDLETLFKGAVCSEPVVIEISKERNALERCMLQFASFERQTEYDRERDTYTCRMWFDPADETELLIRILSFGPVVKVLGPERFLKQIKERITRQINL